MKASPALFFVLSVIEQGTHFEKGDLSSEAGSNENTVCVIWTSLRTLTGTDIYSQTLPHAIVCVKTNIIQDHGSRRTRI